MHAVGVLLLAAATAGEGFGYGSPGLHLKKWLRPHAVMSSAAPGPPMYTAASMAGANGMPGAASGRRFMSTRSQIYFLDPDGMKVGWQTGGGGPASGERVYVPGQLTVPARYNFNQGFIYRLKLTEIPGRPGAALYPTIEVAPTTPATDAYLAHNAIPVQFTPEDFDQVLDGGNFVTKVIYLPDPKYQELAVSGVETLVSTRLEPGIDPILEADKRGTVLLIVRLGAIDLEMPGGGSVLGGRATGPAGATIVGDHGAVITAPMPGPATGNAMELPLGALPPGVAPAAPAAPANVNLDAPAGAGTPPAAPAATSPPVPATEAPAPTVPATEPPAPTVPATEPPPAPDAPAVPDQAAPAPGPSPAPDAGNNP